MIFGKIIWARENYQMNIKFLLYNKYKYILDVTISSKINKVKYFKLRKVSNPLAFNNLTLTASKGKTL